MRLLNFIIWLQLWYTSAVAQKTASTAYELHPIPLSPGLYFEKIDQIRLRSETWRLMLTIDVNDTIGGTYPGRHMIDQEFLNCKKHHIPDFCRTALSIETFDAYDRELLPIQDHLTKILQTPSNERRHHRSPLLGFIGTISRKLFGTMDYKDFEHINKEIDRLYQDQQKITDLIGNSTHIIQAEINSIKQEHNKNLEQLKEEHQRLDELTSTTDYLFKQISDVEYITRLGNMVTIAEYSARKYIDGANKITQAIDQAKHGKINTILMSQQQMEDAVKQIELVVTENIFPITKNKLDLAILSQISTIETAYNKGRFLVIINIPLVARDSMDLFKVIPCKTPQTVQGNKTIAAYIESTAPYYTYSKFTEKYALLNEQYIETCVPRELFGLSRNNTPKKTDSKTYLRKIIVHLT